MTSFQTSAKVVSHLYPPVQLPDDKSTWTIGHHLLAAFEDIRKEILIPSLLGSISLNDEVKRKQNPNDSTLIAPDELSRAECIGEAAQNYLEQIRKTANAGQLLSHYHLGNCGELSAVARDWLNENHVPNCRVVLEWANPDGSVIPEINHSFCLFRTDNKPLNFQSALKDLYHPNMRVIDLWLGQCAHPQEMFSAYADIFKSVQQKNNFVPEYFENGTLFLLRSGQTNETLAQHLTYVPTQNPQIIVDQFSRALSAFNQRGDKYLIGKVQREDSPESRQKPTMQLVPQTYPRLYVQTPPDKQIHIPSRIKNNPRRHADELFAFIEHLGATIHRFAIENEISEPQPIQIQQSQSNATMYQQVKNQNQR